MSKVGHPLSVPFHKLANIGDALYYREEYTVKRQRDLSSLAGQYARHRIGTPDACKFSVRRFSKDDVAAEGSDGLKIIRVPLDYRYDPMGNLPPSRRVHTECLARDTSMRFDRIADVFDELGCRNAEEAASILIKQDPDLAPYAKRIKSWYLGSGQATVDDDPLVGRMEAALTSISVFDDA